MKTVLFTSVCRPLGPDHGDGPSVGHELLHGQVTRAQGIFSPRAVHLHYSLEYIAENIEAPSVVLQYPSRRDLIKELRKGYDYVAVSFVLATFHRMKEVVSLIRRQAPNAKIILGGYGTVLSDEDLAPYGDIICREEGVAFMRRLLDEPEAPKPCHHPLVVSRLKVFSMNVSKTGMIFAGLGCPGACDFCCTSHFFKRRHIKLLPTGKDIYAVIERYLDLDPSTVFVILEEDFLLNKRRAMELRDCVLESNRPISIFAFASTRAISQYQVEEILEMGIDGLWIGFEGTGTSFAKRKGRPIEEIFRELREHGIAVLASMIVGMPYQDDEIVRKELDTLLDLEPALCQFLIYGPTPGTPFYERVVSEGSLREDLAANPEEYYWRCNGFTAMVKHPNLSGAQIEEQQRHCYEQDFQRLGPSIFRTLEISFRGYQKLADSPSPWLRGKARWFASQVRKAYPVFLGGRWLAPNPQIRRRLAAFEKEVHRELGRPTTLERLQSVVALGMALWTAFTLKFKLFQQPHLVRHTYRWPTESTSAMRVWDHVSKLQIPITVEMRPESTVCVRPQGRLQSSETRQLVDRMHAALERTRYRLVLDLEKLTDLDGETARQIADGLARFSDRIRILVPTSMLSPQVAACLALFTLCH